MFPYTVELGVYAFFLITIIVLIKHGTKQDWYVLIFAIIYAIGFELLGVRSGDYVYQTYLVGAFGLPLYIPLCRSLLLSQAMRLLQYNTFDASLQSQHMSGTRLATLFFHTFLATCFVVGFDIVVDVIAVRINLWTWFLPYDQGWFGVTYANYFGRFWVSFLFLFFAAFFRGDGLRKWIKVLVSALVLWAGFLVLILYIVQPTPNHTFSRFFLIQIVVTFLGSLLCVFRPKLYDRGVNKGTTQPAERLRKVTDRLFLVIHLRGVGMSIYLDLHPVLLGISIAFACIHCLYLIKMERRHY